MAAIVREKYGRLGAVILDMDEYRRMLECLGGIEDLRMLESVRKRPLKVRRLDDSLEEHHPGV